jgi:hypothetical protein
MDSVQHLKASLDDLVSRTPKENFHYFKKLKLPEILLKKGVYPYDWVDSPDKMKSTSLLPKEAFFNTLKNTHISDAEYQHALEVWKELKCKTFLDYHRYYLISDVILLTEVVENYRKMSLDNYGLDPLRFPSAPSLSWNAFLKYTNTTIETFCKSDFEILKMVAENMRGGICSRGEITYMNVYGKENEHIVYLDSSIPFDEDGVNGGSE